MKIKNYLIATSCFLTVMQACKKNKQPEPIDITSANYAMSVTGGTYPNQTTYLFGSNQIPTGVVGTANALESSSSGAMYQFGKHIYQNNFVAPATLKKFEFGADGRPKEIGSFSIAGLKTFGSIDFVSETEAYASVNGFKSIPKLIKFNPSNMQIISTLDMASIQKSGSTEVYYQGLLHRDNLLYMGVNYQNADGNLEDKVFIAIIDMMTDKVSKLISDDRSSEMWNGGSVGSFSPNFMIQDNMGDIYAMGYANNGKPSGILKIKKGETNFDADYFFNLSTTTGKPCLGLFNFGSGQTFTIAYTDAIAYPFDINASYDPYATCEYHKIDLKAKTSAGNISTTLPKFFGNSAFVSNFGDDKLYFNVAAANSNSIYSYQLNSGLVQKVFDFESGACNGFAKIK